MIDPKTKSEWPHLFFSSFNSTSILFLSHLFFIFWFIHLISSSFVLLDTMPAINFCGCDSASARVSAYSKCVYTQLIAVLIKKAPMLFLLIWRNVFWNFSCFSIVNVYFGFLSKLYTIFKLLLRSTQCLFDERKKKNKFHYWTIEFTFSKHLICLSKCKCFVGHAHQHNNYKVFFLFIKYQAMVCQLFQLNWRKRFKSQPWLIRCTQYCSNLHTCGFIIGIFKQKKKIKNKSKNIGKRDKNFDLFLNIFFSFKMCNFYL